MGRIIINVVLILMVQKKFSISARIDDEPTCQLNPQMEKQCSFYTYSIVRPLLDYFRQSKEELQRCETKDKIIKDYREKLVHLEINEALIKQLRSQIDFQKGIIDSLSSNLKTIENYGKCKEELAYKSIKLSEFEVQLKECNSGLHKANKEIAKKHEESDLRLQEEYKKLIKIDNDLNLCQNKVRQLNTLQESCKAEIEKLNRTVQNNIPSSCIPGVHEIKVSGIDSFDVLCDNQLAGPGWIVIQQRVGGNESFNRNWTAYREGFGSFERDFFLGLQKIHRLTTTKRYELYVHMIALNGSVYHARYDNFKLSDEHHEYVLSLGKFEGNIFDALRDGENMKFSTFDRDNDLVDGANCADYYKSGWWHVKCYQCNLNAVSGPNFIWGKPNLLKEAKMLIRPKE